jgi:hypothetical protein
MNQDTSSTHDLDSLEKVRSEALQKVGRNVVNFAKIEAALKLLLASINIAGSPKELLKKQQHSTKVNRKKSLGEIAMLLNRSLEREAESSMRIPEILDEIHISLSFRIEDDKGSSKQFQKSLKELAKDRNDLIHHRLAELDGTSARSYKLLIEYLDGQHTKVIAKIEMIRSFFDLLKASHNELANILECYLTQSPPNDDSLEDHHQDAPGPPPMPH